MSLQYPGYQQQTLYQAEPNMSHTLKSLREQFSHICRKHINQHVRVETLDGDVFEGTIVNCNKGILYIQMTMPQQTGQRSFYYNNVILPLVLYELLVITLLA
ncbi:hypothetical protein MUG84_10160 [Paenibacillus sp. KQZ6P-2]|uniref:Uncharacterized protein n=1 Tax=Paenibacillus mangrovi TaxID=2931978 RepID=A0A9X2B2A1_9BACL|nr:hypothetical protein [Paenibacillus mangrovi]MCJ8012106.1 hypothetical protein [Paenibacillus mangrovi]